MKVATDPSKSLFGQIRGSVHLAAGLDLSSRTLLHYVLLNLSIGHGSHVSLVAVEVFGNFLERNVSSFDDEEVDYDQLDQQKAVIKYVVPPMEIVKGDAVDVLIEKDCGERDKGTQGKAFSS